MKKHRGILTALTLLALTAVCAVVAAQVLLFRLPAPHECNRAELFRWVVLRDLRQEDPAIHVALVDRLEREIRAGIELNGAAESLTDEQQARLQRNGDLLKEAWFDSRVDTYFKLSDDRRTGYLDEQIAVVLLWSDIEMSLTEPAGSSRSQDDRKSPVAAFFDRVQRWIDEAGGPTQRRMIEAVEAGVVRWLSTDDVSSQPMSTRRELARHIAGRLDDEPSLDAYGNLPRAERRRLRANGELLMEAWVHLCAEQYDVVSSGRRGAFVNRQIDRVNQWGLIELLAEKTDDADSDSGPPSAPLIQFVAHVNAWIDRADPAEQQRLRNYVDAVTQRLLLLKLRASLGISR